MGVERQHEDMEAAPGGFGMKIAVDRLFFYGALIAVFLKEGILRKIVLILAVCDQLMGKYGFPGIRDYITS